MESKAHVLGGYIVNNIALEKERVLLEYLSNNLIDSPDTSVARCKQQEGLEVFKDLMLLQSAKDMQDNEFKKIYQNSFSRCRSRFDEYSKVSLTSKERK